MSHQVHEILPWQVHRSTRRAIAFCLLLIGSQEVHAQILFRPFSADEIQTLNKQTRGRKVYAIDQAIRFEGEDNGRKVITIIRYDRKAMWFLMPEQKMYMEMANPANPGAEPIGVSSQGPRWSANRLAVNRWGHTTVIRPGSGSRMRDKCTQASSGPRKS